MAFVAHDASKAQAFFENQVSQFDGGFARGNAAAFEAEINIDEDVDGGVVIARQTSEIVDDGGVVHRDDDGSFAGKLDKTLEGSFTGEFIGNEDILDAGMDEFFGLPEPGTGNATGTMLELKSGKFKDAMILEVRAEFGFLRGKEFSDGAEVVLHGVEIHEKSRGFDVGEAALCRFCQAGFSKN